MPLVKGKEATTEKGISENISISMKEGKPQKQAVAIALAVAREFEQKVPEPKPVKKEQEFQTDFTRIKLFGVGKFKPVNGKPVNITPKHLEDMVAFYEKLKSKALPDVIITHSDTKAERDKEYPTLAKMPFSVGKITNLFTDGKALYGDYINVLPPIKKALEDKLLTTHSAEIYEDVKVDGKGYKGILTGVALLPGGKMPALYEIFEPYMYELDTFAEDKVNQIDLSEIEYENKVLFNLQLEDNPLMQKEKEKEKEAKPYMNESDYKGKVQEYMKSGMKPMAYAEFMKMDEDKQKEYMGKMHDEYMGLKKKYEMDTEGDSMKEDLNALQKELQKELAEVRELKKQQFSLVSEMKQNTSEEVAYLRNQVEQMKTEKHDSEVRKFVYGLTKGDEPKFDIADEEPMIAALVHIAKSDDKLSFSWSGQDVEKSPYEVITGVLAKAHAKKSFVHKPLMKSEDGDSVVSVSETEMAELPKNTDVSSVLIDKKVEAYCKKFNLDYDKADDYEKAFDAVSV